MGRAMFLVEVVRLGSQEGNRFPRRVWIIICIQGHAWQDLASWPKMVPWNRAVSQWALPYQQGREPWGRTEWAGRNHSIICFFSFFFLDDSYTLGIHMIFLVTREVLLQRTTLWRYVEQEIKIYLMSGLWILFVPYFRRSLERKSTIGVLQNKSLLWFIRWHFSSPTGDNSGWSCKGKAPVLKCKLPVKPSKWEAGLSSHWVPLRFWSVLILNQILEVGAGTGTCVRYRARTSLCPVFPWSWSTLHSHILQLLG